MYNADSLLQLASDIQSVQYLPLGSILPGFCHLDIQASEAAALFQLLAQTCNWTQLT